MYETKAQIGQRLRKGTTMTLAWIAERLDAGRPGTFGKRDGQSQNRNDGLPNHDPITGVLLYPMSSIQFKTLTACGVSSTKALMKQTRKLVKKALGQLLQRDRNLQTPKPGLWHRSKDYVHLY
jgi:hypothetical protein